MSGPAASRPSPEPTGTGQTCDNTLDSIIANSSRLETNDNGSPDRNDHIPNSPSLPPSHVAAQQPPMSHFESARVQTCVDHIEDGPVATGSSMPGKRNMDGNVMKTWDQPASELLLASSEHSDTEFDADEFSLPLSLARAGLQSSRSYNNSTSFRAQWSGVFQHPGPESPHKVRRVEKAPRARSHVLCHKCNTEFGLQELCKTCGHTRCKECRKRPSHSQSRTSTSRRSSQQFLDILYTEVLPNSVRTIKSSPNLAQDARPTFSLVEVQPTIASSSIPRAEASRNTRSWLERLSPPPESGPVPQSLKADLNSAPSSQQSRPQSPPVSFNHPYEKNPISRTPTHIREYSGASFDLPSMSSAVSDTPQSPAPLSALEEYSNTAKFENPRVYRRARHQVRFICEQCKTVFPTRREMNCPQCGHVRCDHCVRDP
jgi:hypothetical protein